MGTTELQAGRATIADVLAAGGAERPGTVAGWPIGGGQLGQGKAVRSERAEDVRRLDAAGGTDAPVARRRSGPLS